MISATFYINAFVQRKGVLHVEIPLSIGEGTFIGFKLLLLMRHVKVFQTYDNIMSYRAIDAIAMDLNENSQGGTRLFSLLAGKLLQRIWKDSAVHKRQ